MKKPKGTKFEWQIQAILDEHKDGSKNILYADEIEAIADVLKATMNFNQGHIDKEKYESILTGKDTEKSICIKWGIEDIFAVCKGLEPCIKLADDQAMQILRDIKHKHDASIGVNWETIKIFIEEYVGRYNI